MVEMRLLRRDMLPPRPSTRLAAALARHHQRIYVLDAIAHLAPKLANATRTVGRDRRMARLVCGH